MCFSFVCVHFEFKCVHVLLSFCNEDIILFSVLKWSMVVNFSFGGFYYGIYSTFIYNAECNIWLYTFYFYKRFNIIKRNAIQTHFRAHKFTDIILKLCFLFRGILILNNSSLKHRFNILIKMFIETESISLITIIN